MKSSTKDQVEGTFREVKGTMKEQAGRVIKNSRLVREGQAEKVAGKIQKKVAQVERVFEK